jgi:hypothetical protein
MYTHLYNDTLGDSLGDSMDATSDLSRFVIRKFREFERVNAFNARCSKWNASVLPW